MSPTVGALLETDLDLKRQPSKHSIRCLRRSENKTVSFSLSESFDSDDNPRKSEKSPKVVSDFGTENFDLPKTNRCRIF